MRQFYLFFSKWNALRSEFKLYLSAEEELHRELKVDAN